MNSYLESRQTRSDHRRVFEEAVDGYRDRVIAELERRLATVKRGRAFDQYLEFPEPEDHTDDYDHILEMARMSIDDVVEPDRRRFSDVRRARAPGHLLIRVWRNALVADD